MKKTAFLLAALLLAGCQSITPAVPAVNSSVDSAASSSSEHNAPSSDADTPVQGQSSSEARPGEPTVELPAPEELSPAEAGIPGGELFTQALDGYGASLYTPALYDLPFSIGDTGFADSDFFWLMQDGKYALVNESGATVTDFIYDEPPSEWRYVTDGIRAAVFNSGGKYGLLDTASGEELLEAQFESIAGEQGYIVARQTKIGDTFVFDSQLHKRYTMSRGDSLVYAGETDVLFQEGVLRFFEHDTSSPIYNFACSRAELLSTEPESDFVRIGVTIGEDVGVCDERGQWIVVPSYSYIGQFRDDYASVKKDGKYGVIDYDGRVTVRPIWDDMALFNGGASVCQNGKWGTISDLSTGRVSLQPFYDYIGPFSRDGRACFEKGGRYGLLDPDGNVLVSSKYNTPIITKDINLDDGYFAVKGGEGANTLGIVGPGGVYVLPADHVFYPRSLNGYASDDEPYNIVRVPAGRWGYADRTGNFVIDARFDKADGFINGWNTAFVTDGGRICLVNRDGQIVLRTVFSDMLSFNAKTKVCAMVYGDDGNKKICIVQLETP